MTTGDLKVASIKTDTIKDQSGAGTAMTIDTSGRILTPARPAFHVRHSGSDGVQGTIIFNEEDFDIGDNYNTSNGRFTAPIAGIYWFCFDALVVNDAAKNPLADGQTVRAVFLKNGSEGLWSQRSYARVDGATTYSTITRQDCIQLAANDYVTVSITEKFIYVDTSGNYDPVFQGFLIG